MSAEYAVELPANERASGDAGMPSKVYSWEELETEQLVAANGKVYDAKPFARWHPGGAHILELNAYGKEIQFPTTSFHTHSADALTKLAGLQVGVLSEKKPDKGTPANGAPQNLFRWPYVLGTVLTFVALIPATTAPAFGLGRGFTIEGLEFGCYNRDTWRRDVDKYGEPTPACPSFQYPYRLVSPNTAARCLAWLLYLVHAVGQFYCIRGAKAAARAGEITWGPVNTWAVRMTALNVTLVVLKYIHSYIFYDGLAADVPELSALYSVAIWFVASIALEMPRRGWAFGYIRDFTSPVLVDFMPWIRENHGYIISFGLTYNFWYHPLEGTPAFITGYSHQLMMMAQSSMLYHRNHRNIYWTFVLEGFVALHGFITAMWAKHGDEKGVKSQYMFGFGFLAMVVITQIHGLHLSRAARGGIVVGYISLLVVAKVADPDGFDPMVVLRMIFTPFMSGLLVLGYVGVRVLAMPIPEKVRFHPATLFLFGFVLWAGQLISFVVFEYRKRSTDPR